MRFQVFPTPYPSFRFMLQAEINETIRRVKSYITRNDEVRKCHGITVHHPYTGNSEFTTNCDVFHFETKSGLERLEAWLHSLVPGVPGVELSQDGGRNPLQHLLGEDPEQLPPDVEGLEDCAVLIVTLGNEVLLELAQELQVE